MSRYRYGQSVPKRRSMPWGALMALGVCLVLIISITFWVLAYKNSERSVSFTVEDKERVCSGSTDGQSSCKYLIFTDQGTFKITDSLIIGRFSSSDVYGRVKQDRTYDARVIGWRIPVFSMYPNVVNLSEARR